MTNQNGDIIVQIRYKDLQETFTGKPEDVWSSVNRFFGRFLPSFETVSKMTLTVDLQKLLKNLENIIAFSPEGPNLMIPRDKMTDTETLGLWLLANHVGFQLGKLESDSVSKEYLQTRLGKNSKITSTRLGELIKNEFISRTTDDKYKITTFGLVQLQKEIIPKIKSRTAI